MLGQVLPRRLVPPLPSECLPSLSDPQLGVEYACGAKREDEPLQVGVLSSSDGEETQPGAAETSEQRHRF